MKKLIWLTDIHLNFVSDVEAEAFCDDVKAERPDAVLIGGDIGEADSVSPIMETVAERLGCPVYFVLGNHDFYKGSVRQTQAAIGDLCRRADDLVWLDEADPIELTPSCALIGVGGTADGGFGRYDGDFVPLNDYHVIEELAFLGGSERLAAMQRLAGEAADHVRAVLPAALARHEQVFFLTHVPPFAEACWHEGAVSSDEWLPHFACKAVGDALLESMRSRGDRHLTVLCGHTHSPGEAQILPNLVTYTGAAEYARPEIQRVMEIP